MKWSEKAERPVSLARFEDELSAHSYLEKILWPEGPVCPRCGSHGRIGKLDGASTRIGAHKCYVCRRIFSVTHGTIFSSSHVPLHKWLQAIYLTDGGTKPMRPHHLQRVINVSFKTASGMLRRLAEAASAADEDAPSHGPMANPSNRREHPNRDCP
ncbi:transposase [Reyranella sp.]|uniref:transposase n=1 Tax=Reyranella sp. TaxID=1929291 RepID=UPI003BAD7128